MSAPGLKKPPEILTGPFACAHSWCYIHPTSGLVVSACHRTLIFQERNIISDPTVRNTICESITILWQNTIQGSLVGNATLWSQWPVSIKRSDHRRHCGMCFKGPSIPSDSVYVTLKACSHRATALRWRAKWLYNPSKRSKVSPVNVKGVVQCEQALMLTGGHTDLFDGHCDR